MCFLDVVVGFIGETKKKKITVINLRSDKTLDEDENGVGREDPLILPGWRG